MGFVDIDILGKVVSFSPCSVLILCEDLIRHKNEPIRRICPLASPDSEDRPGQLEFTAGYYSKAKPDESLKTDGSDPAIPDDLKNEPEFQEKPSVALNDLEDAVLKTPPSFDLPSGIISYVAYHSLRNRLCPLLIKCISSVFRSTKYVVSRSEWKAER